MAGTIDQIAQRLAALDQDVEALGQQFYETYRGYLTSLGQVVRKQVVLSCYHLCTENFPQRFLQLSVSQRQQLQEDLRDLAAQAEIELLENLKSIKDMMAEFDAIEESDDLDELFGEMDSTPESSLPTLTPLELLNEWQDQIERSISKTLKSTGAAANRLLQNAEILPKRVPQPILEAVAQVEGKEGDSDTPNLLSLLTEANEKGAEASDKSSIAAAALMQVVAVNLRLAEIEFNDPTVMSWRNKLRELKKQFQTIAKEYQKRSREKAIAEAQLAWKSTWVND